MAHFAQLDENNAVIRVIVVDDDALGGAMFPGSEPDGIAFCQSLFGGDTAWKQTSDSSAFRGVYAGAGFAYDPVTDTFLAPEPEVMT